MDNSFYHYGQYPVPVAKDCVNMGVGQPCSSRLPLAEFNKSLENISKMTNPSFLQYGSISGYTEFLQDFANFLLTNVYDPHGLHKSIYEFARYTNESPENILITNGITGALTLILSTMSETGMTIFCEDPTYFLALNIFKDFKLNIKPIKIDKDGIIVDELEKELESETKNCFLYIIPFFQNPTGYSLSQERKYQLCNVVKKYPNLTVLSDEVYSMLRFNNADREESHYLASKYPLCCLHERIVSIGSFSKIFCPSLRMGWIHASSSFIKKLASSGQLDSSGCVNPIGCAIVHDLILRNVLTDILNGWKTFLLENVNSLFSFVDDILGEYIDNMDIPTGGYFLWIKFKDYIDVSFLSEKMEKYGVKFHHGNKFSPSKSCANYMRLSFSWYEGDDYKLGVERIKNLIVDTYHQDKKIKVYIQGYSGKLGSLIVKELEEDIDCVFSGGIDRDFNVTTLLNDAIIVDVSSPVGTETLLNRLLTAGIYLPIIIGTTGDLPNDLITEYSKHATTIVCANFSKGISQFKNMIECINKDDWKVSMTEYHHIHKKDKPSGTAKTLAKVYGEKYLPLDNIISIRDGNIIGTHEITLEGKYETIKIIHTATSRALFAEGCVNMIKDIGEYEKKLYLL